MEAEFDWKHVRAGLWIFSENGREEIYQDASPIQTASAERHGGKGKSRVYRTKPKGRRRLVLSS